MRKKQNRRFRGYAVLERLDGALVWATFRPSADAARAAFERWNPTVAGHEQPIRVVSVSIVIEEPTE